MKTLRSQHYVPKFYLKNFSFQHDRKSISIWVIEPPKYVERGSIANQACRNYFYGQDNNIEDALSQIESHVAPIIRAAIENHQIPPRESELHLTLLAFLISLSLRTKYQADEVNESGDKLFKTAYKYHPALKDNINRFYIATDGAPLLALHSLEPALKLSFDLSYKLLLNNTATPFITSDNPVIKHNQYFFEDTQMGHLGFASTGLQLLLPLSPFACLIFYDQSVYRVGNRQDSTVVLSNLVDVDIINEFQYINADEAIYYNEKLNQAYLQSLASKAFPYRKTSKTLINEYAAPPRRPGTKSSIIHIRPSFIPKSLSLSHIRVLKKAKQKLRTATFDIYRNPTLSSQVLDEEEANIQARSTNRHSIKDPPSAP